MKPTDIRVRGRYPYTPGPGTHVFEAKATGVIRNEDGTTTVRLDDPGAADFWMEVRLPPPVFSRPEPYRLDQDGVHLADAETGKPELFEFDTEAECWALVRGLAFTCGNSDLFCYYKPPRYLAARGKWVVEVTVPES